MSLPVCYKFITSGNDDETFLLFREANAVPRLAPISKALPGSFKALVANFSTASSKTLPKIFEKTN